MFHRSRLDADLDDELRFHLEMSAPAHERRGMTPQAARRAARLEFGPVERLKDDYRDRRGLPWVEQLRQDARYAARTLRRDAPFTVVAIATLALGIGATTAIFSLLRGVVLDPLPYPNPGALVRVFHSSTRFPAFPLSPASFLEYRRHARGLDGIAVYVREDLQLAADDRPERVSALQVSAGYFDVLGTRPALGRGFQSAEEREGARVVVISHALWQRRFGGDPAVVGRSVRLSGEPFTIVGVAPAGFQHVGGAYRSLPHGETVDAWWPVPLERAQERRGWHYLNGIARARRDVSAGRVADELDRLEAGLTPEGQDDRWRVRAVSLEEEIVADLRNVVRQLDPELPIADLRPLDDIARAATAQRRFLLVIVALFGTLAMALAAVGAYGVFAWTVQQRSRELGIRVALGATRAQLLRLVLADGLRLTVTGLGMGWLVAVAGGGVLQSLLVGVSPRDPLTFGGVMLGIFALAGVATLVPALQATRANPVEVLRLD